MTKEEIIRLENRWAELLKGPDRLNEPKVSNTKITAAEFQEQLLQDEEYQKWLKEKEQVRIALEAAYAEDEKPLVEDLKKAGLNITSSWDLVNTKSRYKPAIPILLEHLPKPYHLKNKEGIVRALAVKEAIGKASSVLISEYNRTPKDKVLIRWAIGNTIYTTITEDDVESILPIVLDRTNGTSRQMFVAALGKIKVNNVKDVLLRLVNDDDKVIRDEAKKALKKI
ncbi:HEAT repeat domain-containing protein [Sphingobacterium thalpophilum]|uniref:HEAT repeat domain-containing protein n=1 Tax=Sphingobacterium thalpophilum TaxID=259 RepID=UPI002D77A73A|nr:hypothetical protein [Sphingobacterium thalpophilum]